MKYYNLPRSLTRDSYEQTVQAAAEALVHTPGVHAVYVLGDTWQPGISDMDLLVVCPRDSSLPSPWKLGAESAFIFTHRFLAMSGTAARKFFYLFPTETTNTRLIVGKDITLEDPHETVSVEEYKELISCIFFDVLMTKLLPLMGALRYGQSVNVRSRIGELYSLRYSEKLLNLLCGYEMSTELRNHIVTLRSGWFERNEQENLRMLEEISAQSIDLIVQMVERFALYSAEKYALPPKISFRNRRYTVRFINKWNKELFLRAYKRGHTRIKLLNRTFEHDLLLMPQALAVFFAWYAAGEGPFSRRVRMVVNAAAQTLPAGIGAHLKALNDAFADYEASHGTHKIPYAFGFSPDPRPLWRAVASKLKRMLLPPPAEPTKTPVVIPLRQFATFDEYLKALSANKRSEYRRAMQQNQISWQPVPFDRDEVKRYMDLWSRQLVYGKPITWKFGIEQVEEWNRQRKLLVFKGGDECLQFAVQHDYGLECHPTMYDKSKHTRIAKFMFFKLIEYIIVHHLGDLDLGFISSAEEGTQYKQNYLPGHRKQI